MAQDPIWAEFGPFASLARQTPSCIEAHRSAEALGTWQVMKAQHPDADVDQQITEFEKKMDAGMRTCLKDLGFKEGVHFK
jgi:hypothetical protein